jgi:steroid delta-isomerase-like uncharacterized protein
MNRDEMFRLFEAHREAEAARDYDAILATFTEDCFFETVPLGLRSEGRDATRAAYEGFFTAFPDVSADDQGRAVGDDVVVVWGTLRGTNDGDWLGVPPGGGPSLCRSSTSCLQGRLDGRRTIYFDLATLCQQVGLDVDRVRAAAKARAGSGSVPATG